jgi:hypothetical protein
MPLLVLIAFSGIGLGLYGYLGNFTRMLADDFCSSYFAGRLGLFRSVWYWYLNWSGRYTAFAMDWLILQFALGPYKLHYFVPATILIWLTFITCTLYLYLRKNGQFGFLSSLSLACIFLFTVFVLSPNLPQSLFWWNGMRSYALPLLVLTFYLLIFQLNIEYFKLNTRMSSVLGFVLFFISGGLGETFVVAQIAFLLFVVCMHILKQLNRPRADLIIVLSSLAGSVCSLIVIVLAPGNAIRLGASPSAPNLLELISISVQSYAAFIGGFLSDPSKIAGIVGAMLAVMWIGGHYTSLAFAKDQLVFGFGLGGIAISFICFPPGVYGYFESPPTRTMMIPVFFFVAGVLCASFLFGVLSTRYDRVWQQAGFLILLALLIFGFSAVTTSWRLYQARNIYIDFAEKWDRVDAQILEAKTNKLESVNIPDLSGWAALEIPTDNAKYWPTVCYSRYYDIQVVGPPAPYP